MPQRLSGRSTPRGGAEASDQKRGFNVIAVLAVLTAVEYLFAIAFDAPATLVVVLAAAAVVKAWLIVIYFMHLPLVWHGEEA